MTALIDIVTKTITAVCPIDGISLGSLTDKTTWRIDYHSTATADQQAAAQTALAGIVVADQNSNIKILAQIAALEATQTPRRMRESLVDPTWIKALDAQIVTLRGQLK